MGFVGSGDIKTGAFAYWSVARAYTAAYAAPGTNPCVDLVDQAGLNPITIAILSTGLVDIASIKAWVTAHSVTTIKVKKLYDQSGNGFHVSQATLANMPILLLTHPGLGNNPNLPTMHFIQSASMTLSSGATGLSSAVGTFSIVGRVDAWFGGGIIQASPFGLKGIYNGVQFYAGSAPSAGGPLSDSFNAYQAIFNGASSQACVNGTMGGFVNAGTGPLGSPFVFGQWNNGFVMGGETSEIRFDSSAWSSADCAAETANQIAFWFGNSPAHEGIVASRCRVRLTQESTNKYYNSRSAHIASEDLTAIKVAFESPAGTTLTASVEYPAGTMTQLTFGGSTSGVIGAISVFSDYATVSIPKGATFWIRQFENATSGGFIRYNTWQNSFLGEAMELSVTVLTDKTMSGTIANSGTPLGNSAPPAAIVGVTKARSVMLIGDSIGHGQADTEDSSASATGFNDVVGFLDRAIDSLGIPFVNCCFPGTAISGYGPSIYHSCCTHLISQFSLNDFDASETSATVITDLSNFGYFVAPATKYYQTTCTPHSSSSDGWVTLVNQSAGPTGGFDTQRNAFNSALRAGTSAISRLTGYIDIASILESGIGSNKWTVSPSPPYTPDGRHPYPAGHALVLAAGVVQAIFAIQSPKNKRNLVLRKRA